MDSMSLFQVTGYAEHPPIGSLSRRERVRVRANLKKLVHLKKPVDYGFHVAVSGHRICRASPNRFPLPEGEG
jgi:hypothetical protein